MIDSISKYSRTTNDTFYFSLLIPSWNNLDYLKNCIESIRKNSSLQNQIIVIVNEGKDGTANWVKSQPDIDYILAKENIGICYGLNIARSLVKSDYIIYINDDMYVLPDWDKELYQEILNIGTKSFMLSSTMIEPESTNNPSVIVKNYGGDLKTFKQELLLKEYEGLKTKDWSGSMWPPNVVHTDMWDLVGGMSIEFSPGMYSDPDFARKLFEAGVRIFKGKGTSLVYHFGSKSTKRIRKSRGRKIFLSKWGISASIFRKHFLKHGNDYSNENNNFSLTRKTLFINKIKRVFNSFQ
jgi:GT2 family glycosyltransferase